MGKAALHEKIILIQENKWCLCTKTRSHLETTALCLLCSKPSTFTNVIDSSARPGVSSLFKGGRGWEVRNGMSCKVGAES